MYRGYFIIYTVYYIIFYLSNHIEGKTILFILPYVASISWFFVVVVILLLFRTALN